MNSLRWPLMHLRHGIEFHQIGLYDRRIVRVHYRWQIGTGRGGGRSWWWQRRLWGRRRHVIHVRHLEFWRLRLLSPLPLWRVRIMLRLLLILLWLLNRLRGGGGVV